MSQIKSNKVIQINQNQVKHGEKSELSIPMTALAYIPERTMVGLLKQHQISHSDFGIGGPYP